MGVQVSGKIGKTKFTVYSDLDKFLLFPIIRTNIVKNCDEDEYALKRQYREQEMVRACLDASAEWPSEL